MIKHFFAILCFATLLCGCSLVSHEMKDDANFEGLTLYYLEEPVSTKEIFAALGNVDTVDNTLKETIINCLKERGYTLVSNKSEAQIIFRPQWNATVMHTDNIDNFGSQTLQSTIGTSNAANTYATLEIQAILPNSGDMWSWRGFSYSKTCLSTLTTAQIKDQVYGSLKYFPPENILRTCMV